MVGWQQNPNRKNSMPHLKPVFLPFKPVSTHKPILNAIHTGARYLVSCQDLSTLNSTHGVIGGYRMTSESAEIFQVEPKAASSELSECYFWDTDIDLSQLQCKITLDIKDQLLSLQDSHLKSNRLLLNGAELTGPQITVSDEKAALILSPRFDVTFSTDSCTAQLGLINLVQATRFITLENGSQINLLDTGKEELPVLYLENQRDDQAIKFVTAPQQSGVTEEHTFNCDISQPIPVQVDGETVASVTVLEQYWSYFMQRAVPLDDHHNIWIPVYAPIQWGWSIRVGRRTDGEWGILRRKLILPTTGHDGFQLPVWNNNTVNCSPMVEAQT